MGIRTGKRIDKSLFLLISIVSIVAFLNFANVPFDLFWYFEMTDAGFVGAYGQFFVTVVVICASFASFRLASRVGEARHWHPAGTNVLFATINATGTGLLVGILAMTAVWRYDSGDLYGPNGRDYPYLALIGFSWFAVAFLIAAGALVVAALVVFGGSRFMDRLRAGN